MVGPPYTISTFAPARIPRLLARLPSFPAPTPAPVRMVFLRRRGIPTLAPFRAPRRPGPSPERPATRTERPGSGTEKMTHGPPDHAGNGPDGPGPLAPRL